MFGLLISDCVSKLLFSKQDVIFKMFKSSGPVIPVEGLDPVKCISNRMVLTKEATTPCLNKL